MTIDDILNECAQRKGYFPKEAVVAAIEQKEAITPYLLEELQFVVPQWKPWFPYTSQDN